MKFKYYLRKSSFKKDIASASLLLDQINLYKPKNFLEVGVFQGVTSRNVCEKLYEINKDNLREQSIWIDSILEINELIKKDRVTILGDFDLDLWTNYVNKAEELKDE